MPLGRRTLLPCIGWDQAHSNLTANPLGEGCPDEMLSWGGMVGICNVTPWRKAFATSMARQSVKCAQGRVRSRERQKANGTQHASLTIHLCSEPVVTDRLRSAEFLFRGHPEVVDIRDIVEVKCLPQVHCCQSRAEACRTAMGSPGPFI